MASIGEQLKQAREAKGSTISQAASATRIKFQHIESIEHNDFSKMAAAAYARGFIKIYAEYLGLDPAPLLELYAVEHSPVEPRPTLSDEPRRTPPPAVDAAAAEPSGETWMDQAFAAELLKRIVLPVGVIVALVVLVVGLARLLQTGGEPVDPVRLPENAPLLIEEPPDPYLAVPQTRERMP
jgi:cytoskeletal protein RodZ